MKALFVLAVLFAATNALSLDSLRSLLREELEREQQEAKRVLVPGQSLREYLNSVETPHPLYRAARNEALCSAGCPPTPHLDVDRTCASGRWVPDYEKHPELGCDCLKRYTCCSGTCAVPNKEGCWGQDGGEKGRKFATIEKDCCDCDVVKCVNCPAPANKTEACPKKEVNSGARPLDCYSYVKEAEFAADENKCFLPKCTELPSAGPADEVCDQRCQSDVANENSCEFPFNTCAPKSGKPDCPGFKKETAQATLDPAPLVCYHAPTEVADTDGGFFYSPTSQKCEQCTKWDYQFKSCAAQNILAAAEDCHQYGSKSLDKKCFQKEVKQDQCGCDVAECVSNNVKSEDEFEAEEVCPGGHVKMSGVSICLHPRDICKMCPMYIEMDPSDCPKGVVEKSQDCNGCPVSKCVRATVPTDECLCNKYGLDQTTNTLYCDCGPSK